MSTYTQILYQIIFSTKYRACTLTKAGRPILFQYIGGLLKNKQCHVYKINGVEDHLHIVTHLHPSIALASLVKDIKVASSAYIKEQQLFKNFEGWQDGYGAFTYSIKERDRLIDYVQQQEIHHHTKSFREEYRDLLNEQGIAFEEQYLL
ncbi:MAG: IS200/IS605 family transposase [Chitinophagaceae bacterium]